MGLLDARKAERYSFSEDVIIDEQVFSNCVDISVTGLYIKTSKPFDVGAILMLSIPSYGLEVGAEVKHCQPSIGMGLQFLFTTDDERQSIVSLIKSIEDTGGNAAEKRTILVVDDNRSIRAVLRSKLMLEGYSVAEAEDGMDAIRKMNSFDVHAVVLDINMSKIDGLKLLSMIRSAPNHKTTPVIMFSSNAKADVVERAKRNGADAFLPKSTTSPASMVAAIKGVLKQKGI